MDTGIRAVLTDVLRERFRRTVAEAVCRARCHGAHADGGETFLDEVCREGAGGRRNVQTAVTRRAVDRGRDRPRAVGVEHRDEPEDSEVLHPRGALDQRTEIEPVVAGLERRLDRELEPCHLARTDVGRRLDRDAIEARPAGRR